MLSGQDPLWEGFSGAVRLADLHRVTDGNLNGSWEKPDSPKWAVIDSPH